MEDLLQVYNANPPRRSQHKVSVPIQSRCIPGAPMHGYSKRPGGRLISGAGELCVEPSGVLVMVEYPESGKPFVVTGASDTGELGDCGES